MFRTANQIRQNMKSSNPMHTIISSTGTSLRLNPWDRQPTQEELE